MNQVNDKIYLEIVAPNNHIVLDNLKEVRFADINGSATLLCNHEAFLSVLASGYLMCSDNKNMQMKYEIGQGYMHFINPSTLHVIVETVRTLDKELSHPNQVQS